MLDYLCLHFIALSQLLQQAFRLHTKALQQPASGSMVYLLILNNGMMVNVSKCIHHLSLPGCFKCKNEGAPSLQISFSAKILRTVTLQNKVTYETEHTALHYSKVYVRW